jgi:hypothetical protein
MHVTAPMGVDEATVAQFLLGRKYFLAALELHQELLEGNNGIHNVGCTCGACTACWLSLSWLVAIVAVLNRYFTEPANLAAVLKSTEEKTKQNKANGAYTGVFLCSKIDHSCVNTDCSGQQCHLIYRISLRGGWFTARHRGQRPAHRVAGVRAALP